MSELRLEVKDLAKTFTLHTRGGVRIPVFQGLSCSASGGQCVVLSGPSGSGKSTLLRSLYGNYKPSSGSIRFVHDGEWMDLTDAPARQVLELRARTVGYVSQFLRVIPRVSALDVVAEPLLARGSRPTRHVIRRPKCYAGRISLAGYGKSPPAHFPAASSSGSISRGASFAVIP